MATLSIGAALFFVSPLILQVSHDAVRPAFAFAVLSGLFIGLYTTLIRGRNTVFKLETLDAMKKAQREIRNTDVLARVNNQLRSQLSTQIDVINILNNQLLNMREYSLAQINQALIRTARIIAGAKKCSIWKFSESELRLDIVSSWGWGNVGASNGTLMLTGSLEGWVVRTKSFFSVRMLLENPELRELDTRKSLIIVPILIGNRVWGVFSIEDMPLEFYNIRTEQIVKLSTALAAAIIDHLVLVQGDRVTKIPDRAGEEALSSLSEFLQSEREVLRLTGQQSLLLLLDLSFPQVIDLSVSAVFDTVMGIMYSLVNPIVDFQGTWFDYKKTGQAVLYVPDIELDRSAALMDTIERALRSVAWKIGSESAIPEVLMGFALVNPAMEVEPAVLFELLETTLEMQR